MHKSTREADPGPRGRLLDNNKTEVGSRKAIRYGLVIVLLTRK